MTRDPKLPAAMDTLVAELERLKAKCRPGYMVSKFVVGWISDALAIASAVRASIANEAAPPAPTTPAPEVAGLTDATRAQLLAAIDGLMDFRPSGYPSGGMVRGGPYVRLDEVLACVREIPQATRSAP
jgi:hypothetical protein